jgi:hypothetical protein
MKRLVRTTATVTAAALLSSGIAQTPVVGGSSTSEALVASGSVTEVQITGRAGVPGNATAAVLNLTALDAAAAGFVTAYACGTTMPDVSNLNYIAGPSAIANSATVPIGAGGKICLYTSAATNLIVDINGWYPANSGFTTTPPTRLHDTRPAPAPPAPPVPNPPAGPPPTGLFVETFDGNRGLDRFSFGVYHRDNVLVANTSWQADHDHSCGDPATTSRTVRRDTNEWIYVCRDHLMTSIGDTSGYSTGYFAPKQTFTNATRVSWDVNITDLGARQWWEVAIMPASFNSGVASCPQCSVMPFLSPEPSGLPAYPRGSIVVGNGAFGKDVNVSTDGVNRNVAQYQSICSMDPTGCGSKAIRRPFSITDNRNGTVTINFGGFRTFTVPGAFPAGGFYVVLKDHNYTPDKDGTPVGHTWHWDNIVVA